MIRSDIFKFNENNFYYIQPTVENHKKIILALKMRKLKHKS